MLGVWDVAWCLEDMNVYSVVGGEEERRGRWRIWGEYVYGVLGL